ncbi:MAG TPA: Rrf2 family transcriptional regulator [Stackebrandtia sp.]|jgi:Rrf2 family protein|uniref:RrF2 family transcriptional regulator n=1 Tax=Stackebrandtia sp. TaxID=2023065 RepID=UPI002D5F5D2D|nr:Rrf2 family transcriptional regulator [Stackebrandtia sp.]HZE41770.1 Rrf2 family transcriptional regulator [Stackebrandtia sp.]
MRLSARVDYALRAAVELTVSSPAWTPAEKVAAAADIPGKFCESILLQLRRGGLIESRRGPDGGHRLARPARDITLADIIRVVDGPLVGVRGRRPEHVDYSGAAHALQDVWIALRASERKILESVTLANVSSGKLPTAVRKLTEDPAAWS